jgi:hypothetical protein
MRPVLLRLHIEIPGDDPEDMAVFMMDIGPLSRVLKEQAVHPDDVNRALLKFIRSRTNEYGRLLLGASVSIVMARA